MFVQGLELAPLTSKIMSDRDASFTVPISFLVVNWMLGS